MANNKKIIIVSGVLLLLGVSSWAIYKYVIVPNNINNNNSNGIINNNPNTNTNSTKNDATKDGFPFALDLNAIKKSTLKTLGSYTPITYVTKPMKYDISYDNQYFYLLKMGASNAYEYQYNKSDGSFVAKILRTKNNSINNPAV